MGDLLQRSDEDIARVQGINEVASWRVSGQMSSELPLTRSNESDSSYPRCQDLENGYPKDDDAASWISTMASFYSEHSFNSDRSSLSSCSDRSISSSRCFELVPELEEPSGAFPEMSGISAEHGSEQGSPVAAKGTIGAAFPGIPGIARRHFNHARTRSMRSTQMPNERDPDAEPRGCSAPSDLSSDISCAVEAFARSNQRKSIPWTASLPTLSAALRRPTIRFASPLVEEEEDTGAARGKGSPNGSNEHSGADSEHCKLPG